MKQIFVIFSIGYLVLGIGTAHYSAPIEGCKCKGKKLYGKVRVVSAFADFRVREVSAFEDLKVMKVGAFPDACGKWEFVTANEDFTVQFVDVAEDFTVRYVAAFPGMP